MGLRDQYSTEPMNCISLSLAKCRIETAKENQYLLDYYKELKTFSVNGNTILSSFLSLDSVGRFCPTGKIVLLTACMLMFFPMEQFQSHHYTLPFLQQIVARLKHLLRTSFSWRIYRQYLKLFCKACL